MNFPIASLLAEHRELGLVVAVGLGFAFGFVLERIGFGRSTKLAAQFYLHDMTVFKAMFSGILTAMLLVLIAGGMGILDIKVLSEGAVSNTYMLPMLIGGLMLGIGFVISGYCPGTSIVATASGNIDGIFAFGGILLGSILFAELLPISPWLAKFHVSGDKGQLFLYQDGGLNIPAALLAGILVIGAVAAFIGAEKVERIQRAKLQRDENADAFDNLDNRDQNPTSRKMVFAGFGTVALVALATLALPRSPEAAQRAPVAAISPEALAHRVVDAPWSLRLIDIRESKACATKRVPGSECVTTKDLDKLGLAYTAGARDLVLVAEWTPEVLPEPLLRYPGKVLVLEGGFPGWRAFALTKPRPPAEGAPASAQREYAFRSAFHAAMTGRKAPPPPKANKRYVPKKRKKKGGGCS